MIERSNARFDEHADAEFQLAALEKAGACLQDALDAERKEMGNELTPKVYLGVVQVSAKVAQNLPASVVLSYLASHQTACWGSAEEEECENNERAMRGEGGTVVISRWIHYDVPNGRVMDMQVHNLVIITHHPLRRSHAMTEILYPSEY